MQTVETTSSVDSIEPSSGRRPFVCGCANHKQACGEISLTLALEMGASLTRFAGQTLHLHLGDTEKEKSGSHLLVGLPPCVGVWRQQGDDHTVEIDEKEDEVEGQADHGVSQMPLEVAPIVDLRWVIHAEVAVRYREVLVNLPHDHGDIEGKQNPMEVDEKQQNGQDSLGDHLW